MKRIFMSSSHGYLLVYDLMYILLWLLFSCF